MMSDYGYQILQALITDIDPDIRVKQAMNEIISAKRRKYAVLFVRLILLDCFEYL